jgi:uncharacterized phage-associated protein
MKKQPINVFDFDDCIQRLSGPRKLGLVQRHKLIYFAWRTFVIGTGKAPFKSRIEAWQYGPVFVELQEDQARRGDAGKLDELMVNCCRDTIKCFGHLSGEKLIKVGHQQCGEWQIARLFVPRGKRGPEITPKKVLKAYNRPLMAFYQ